MRRAYNGRRGKLLGASRDGLTAGLYDPSPCGEVPTLIKLACTPPYGTPPIRASPGEASPAACSRPGLFCCRRFHICHVEDKVSPGAQARLAGNGFG